jgi:hypothetical protein
MRSRPTLILLLALLLLGCRGNINKSTFTRIKPNMSLQEVEGLLGPGKEMSDEEMLAAMKRSHENAPQDVRQNAEKMTTQAVQSYTGRIWQEGKKSIVVFFRDGRVQLSYKFGLE